jgi:hypothetical protein
MKNLNFELQWASFLGLGIAWQRNRIAICIPFVMLEISWTKY